MNAPVKSTIAKRSKLAAASSGRLRPAACAAGLRYPQAPSSRGGGTAAACLQCAARVQLRRRYAELVGSWCDQFFNDPTLTSLVDQAVVGNQQLKILAQDIAIANNEIMSRRGAYLPFISLGGARA